MESAYAEIKPETVGIVDIFEIFDHLKNRKFLHLSDSDNGCSVRARIIQNILEAAGMQHGNINIEMDEDSAWYFHNAATVTTDSGITFVLDPAEFDKPMQLKDWKHTG